MSSGSTGVVVTGADGADPFAHALEVLARDGVPFLAGGAVALALYTGIERRTKDLDLFVLETDLARAVDALVRAGFRVEEPFPHWLAKAWAGDRVIDLIFGSGNGLAQVDCEWFQHARSAVVHGRQVLVCPPEETIWVKAFVMERERFDGADVTHLLLACGPTLDWKRLLRRFGEHWHVLLSHLVLFDYAFWGETWRVPRWVMDQLIRRLRREQGAETPTPACICRGTLLSREQYLPDLLRGWQDARLPPTGSMSARAVEIWTEAIGRKS